MPDARQVTHSPWCACAYLAACRGLASGELHGNTTFGNVVNKATNAMLTAKTLNKAEQEKLAELRTECKRLTMAQIYARGFDELILQALVKDKSKSDLATELCADEKRKVDAMPPGKGALRGRPHRPLDIDAACVRVTQTEMLQMRLGGRTSSS